MQFSLFCLGKSMVGSSRSITEGENLYCDVDITHKIRRRMWRGTILARGCVAFRPPVSAGLCDSEVQGYGSTPFLLDFKPMSGDRMP
jgi:hypothetical protein